MNKYDAGNRQVVSFANVFPDDRSEEPKSSHRKKDHHRHPSSTKNDSGHSSAESKPRSERPHRDSRYSGQHRSRPTRSSYDGQPASPRTQPQGRSPAALAGRTVSPSVNTTETDGTGKLRAGVAFGAMATFTSAMAIAGAIGFAAAIPVVGWVMLGVAGLVIGGISLAILLKGRPKCLIAIGAFGALTVATAAAATIAALFTTATIVATIPIGGWVALGIAGFLICKVVYKALKKEEFTGMEKLKLAANAINAITLPLFLTTTMILGAGAFLASGGWILVALPALAWVVYKLLPKDAPTPQNQPNKAVNSVIEG